MAAILPSDIFPGYEYVPAAGTVIANSIVIPLSNLPALSEAEAAELDGNGAQLIRAIDLAVHEAIAALPEIERPSNITFESFEERTTSFSRVKTLSKTYREFVAESAFDLIAEA